MRKHVILTCIILLPCFFASAQRYALIDPTFSNSIRFVNNITAKDMQQKLIPVESKYLPEFLKALQSIKSDLNNNHKETTAKSFDFGCTHISGMVAALARETRFNYVIKSDCDKMKASFLICDVKLKNPMNSFIIGTWIKYIKANLKK